MVMHTVTLWEVTLSIIRTKKFCGSVGTLRMIPVWLACLSQLCSTVLNKVQSSQCTMIQYTSSSHYETNLSQMYQHA